MDFTTPPGRLVWGHPLKGRGKTNDAGQPILGDDGKQTLQWAFGLAIPKNQAGPLYSALQSETLTMFPQGAPAGFAWKIVDGDSTDANGKPYSAREGYAGCVVLAISTEAFSPRVVRLQGGAYVQLGETEIKTGDYVRVALVIKVHGSNPQIRGSKPGLYLNPNLIEFVGYGPEIVSGPDPMAVFGGQQVALPPGASAAPTAPANPMPGAPAAMPQAGPPAAPGQTSAMPSATAYPSNPPAAAPAAAPGFAPAPDFVANATGAPATTAAPAAGFPGQPAAAPGGLPPGMNG